jgi:hypothetical protein
MHDIVGILTLAFLFACFVLKDMVHEVITREYDTWAFALAKRLVALASVLRPNRRQEWKTHLWEIQNYDGDAGLIRAFHFFVDAFGLVVLEVLLRRRQKPQLALATAARTVHSSHTIAYCVKCKSKHEMGAPKIVTMKNGRPATKGTCPRCGIGMYKIG